MKLVQIPGRRRRNDLLSPLNFISHHDSSDGETKIRVLPLRKTREIV